MPQSGTKVAQSYKLHVFADYHQFYLLDEHTQFMPPDDWEEQLVTQLIATAPGIIGVGTMRNMSVPVNIYLLSERPGADISPWNHIAEASLALPSGQLVIMGSSDSQAEALHLPVDAGNYRARVHYRGLASISENGFVGDDYYHILLWPQALSEPQILKRWIVLS